MCNYAIKKERDTQDRPKNSLTRHNLNSTTHSPD
jgi:hypothetical protein